MSLLDVFDNQFGGSSSGLGVSGLQSDFGSSGSSPQVSPGYTSGGLSTTSQQRGVPERLDINNFVPSLGEKPLSDQLSGGATQALEVAGKAPGFALERPLAVADTVVQKITGQSPLDAIQHAIGSAPVVGGLLGGAGDVLHNVQNLPAALANSSTAAALAQGTKEGWSDNQLLANNTGPAADFFRGLAAQFGLGGTDLFKSQVQTWGQYKEAAAQKGWTADDIQAVIDGKKAVTDFGDHRMSSDSLTEMALRFGSDPTNLAFGAGAFLKIGKGVGLLGDAIKAGAELKQPLAVADSINAVAKADSVGATWRGIAGYFGNVGRGIGEIPGGTAAVQGLARGAEVAGRAAGAYKKVALGTTGAQVGIGLAGNVVDALDPEVQNGTKPHSGFLEPLFDLNRAAIDNQPFSNNTAFSLFSGFHIGLHEFAGPVMDALKTAKVAALGHDAYPSIISKLADGWTVNGHAPTAADVEARMGGRDNVNNLVMHVMANRAFDKVMQIPAVKAALEHYNSLDEAVLANQKVAEIVKTIIVDDAKKGINGKELAQRLDDWHANRVVDGKQINPVQFPWNGADAIDRWQEYSSAAAPVSDVFKQRGDVILGLRDHVLDLDIQHMGYALKLASEDGKTVRAGDVHSWLSRYPQLIADDPSWQQYLALDKSQPVPLGPVFGKIKRAMKTAPTAREFTHEAGAAETGAARSETETPLTTDAQRGQLVESDMNGGSARVNVSRMRPQVAKTLGLDQADMGSVIQSRRDPTIQTFEENIGPAMERAGLPVDHVVQAVGAWEGKFEPSIEIPMSSGRLPELRTAAALAGDIGKQDSTILTVTGDRIPQLGLKPNGTEIVWQLPTSDVARLRAVADATGRVLPGFTLNDTTGLLRLVLKQSDYTPALHAKLNDLHGEISSLFPKDLMGDTGIRSSQHPAYVEFLSKKKGEGDLTYADALREARSYRDPRASVATRNAIAESVRYTSPAEANAGRPNLGSEAPVERGAGNPGRTEDHLSLQTPAERVGLGRAEDATKDPGYLYHVTDLQAAQSIAGDALRPNDPTFRQEQLAWPDGGSGKRTYFTRDPQQSVPFQTAGPQALIRVKEAKAGRIADEFYQGPDAFASRKIGSQHLEVFGGDGQWHALDGFFDNGVEPDILAAAKTVESAYPPAPSGPVDPRPGPLAQGLRAQEDAAAAARGAGNEASLLAELKTLTADGGAYSPENAARAQELNNLIEATRLAKGQIKRGDVLYNAQRDAAVSLEYPLHHSLSGLDDVSKADLKLLDSQIGAMGGTYGLKAAPNLARFFEENQGSLIADYLKGRTKLGDALANNFVTGRVGHLMDWLTTPVSNSMLGRQAKQALYASMLPHGAKTEQVDTFLRTLREESQRGAVGTGHLKLHIFRPTAQDINAIAGRVFDKKTITSVGADNFAKLLDQAGNRFIRASDAHIRAGTAGSLERTLNRVYKGWQGTIPGDVTRLASKTMYPLLRFYSDPRWWAMNLVETDLLAGTKYGLNAIRGASSAEPGVPALTHSHGSSAAAAAEQDGNGWMYVRGHAGFASKAFDAARPESTIEFIHSMENQPLVADMKSMVAQLDAQDGRTVRTPGEITDQDLAAGMDRLLYGLDKQGAKDLITTEARNILTPEQLTDPAMAAFLTKLWERNDGLYKDVVHTLSGNPSRSNLERIANSWWLYWPISYQIKAARHLVGIMGEKFGGKQTNLAGAALYAHYYEEHKKAIASDPSYAKLYSDNPTLWFLAQMLLPITPGDIGVSLGRPVRYVGGQLGLWGKYKQAQDPVTAAGAIMSVGPTYTAELLARLARETLQSPTAPTYVVSPQSTYQP